MSAPRFSLILPSIGRVAELERFLASLAGQGEPDWELILVDQNEDDRLAALAAKYGERFPLKHLRSKPGLSRARNVGLAAAAGELLAFPDDDCWYPEGLLPAVATRFHETPDIDGLCGRGVDPEGRPLLSGSPGEPGPVSARKIWRQGISIGIFLRRRALADLGGFDETLGAGAGSSWGSGEETDLLLRLLASGRRLEYDPSLRIFHPAPPERADAPARRRARAYGAGMGRVMRQNNLPPSFAARQILRALAGAAYMLLRGKPGRAALYLAAFRGRLTAYLGRD
jgi:glycosyltransferase involved in cell wall biosynthesis